MMTAQTSAERPVGEDSAQMAIADQIEELFLRAEPRLLRLARSQRIAPDAAEDIVQETLLEAWRSLDHLRDEARFAAWLDGICRNVCRRHQRKAGIMQAHETALENDEEGLDALAQLTDPDSFDPTEELMRQDMAVLLNRALGRLAPESRAVVEQHYLAEIPQRELAARMGLTLSALEARLHRARGQMLRVLGHELRAEALALGLAIDPADATGWRETRIWCIFCGQQRMSGIFEPMPDGRINLRVRCPACAATEISSLGLVDLSNARSFLPAAKKLVDEAGRFYSAAMAAGGWCRCWICGQQSQLRVFQNESLAPRFGLRTWIGSDCACLCMYTFALSLYSHLPPVRDFIFGADRVMVEPEVEMSYAGQDAIRFSLFNPAEGRHVRVFAAAATLLPLAVVME